MGEKKWQETQKEKTEHKKELSKHYQTLQEEKDLIRTYRMWQTKKGRIHVSKMSEDHIMRAKGTCMKFDNIEIGLCWKEVFEEELKRRRSMK